MMDWREYEKWYDNKHWMKPGGENGVLFSAVHAVARDKAGKAPIEVEAPGLVYLAIDNAIEDTGDRLSHDNVTGIVAYSKLFGHDYHREYFHRDWWYRLHPRDIGFYLFNLSRFGKVLSVPFLPILVGSMIWACWHKQITNGTLDTDGKQLAWLRVVSLEWNWLHDLLTKIVNKRHGGWYNVFLIYYRSSEHPIVKLIGEIYGK